MKSLCLVAFQVVFPVVFLALASCASLQEMQVAWQQENCNRESAYTKGMNDGREGKSMAPYSGQCPAESQDQVRVGYREGYNAGIEAVAKTTPGSVINVNFGGGGSISADPAGGSYARRWFCEMSLFGKTYQGFGPTQMEATQSVERRCMAENNEIHCHHGANCKINQ